MLDQRNRRELRNEIPQVAPKGSQPGGPPIIIETNSPLGVKPLGEKPEYIDCLFCRSRAITRVTHEDSTSTTFVTSRPYFMAWLPFDIGFADDGKTDLRGSYAAC